MSKKWVALLLVACVALAGGVVYVRMNADTKGPERIISDNAGTLYRPDMNNEELLAGVTATDDKDGDVSPSLTVESVYEVDDTHVIITYTAKDSSNNITKQKYEMEMDSSSAPKNSNDNSGFGEKTDDADAEATTGVDTEQSKESETMADSDKSSDAGDNSSVEEDEREGTPTPTPEVDEAAAEKEKQEAEADAMPAQNPRIYLSDYLIKVPVGTSVDLLSYVSEIKDDSDDVYTLWRKVQITGEVNSAVPGTYKCTYYVIDSQNNISNNAVLTVIVE